MTGQDRPARESVLPGGRNSGQKAQEGPEKKKCWPEEFVAEFWPKFAEKGPKKFVERISFFYSYDKHSVTTTKFKYNFVDPSAERCFLCEN
jgi:hypothetical protein